MFSFPTAIGIDILDAFEVGTVKAPTVTDIVKLAKMETNRVHRIVNISIVRQCAKIDLTFVFNSDKVLVAIVVLCD